MATCDGCAFLVAARPIEKADEHGAIEDLAGRIGCGRIWPDFLGRPFLTMPGEEWTWPRAYRPEGVGHCPGRVTVEESMREPEFGTALDEAMAAMEIEARGEIGIEEEEAI